jgi:hypothetical protein
MDLLTPWQRCDALSQRALRVLLSTINAKWLNAATRALRALEAVAAMEYFIHLFNISIQMA